MTKQLTKHSIALALAGSLGMATSAANAASIGGADFTFDETAVPGIVAPTIDTANNLNFNYTARINQSNSIPGDPLNNDPFKEAGFFDVGSFFYDAAAVPSTLNATAVLGGYSLYGVFDAEGTASYNGVGITATFTVGTLTLYLDPDQNTEKTVSGPAVPPPLNMPTVTRVNTTDDLLIGSATLLTAGEANLFGGLANGDYELVWGDWALTAFGPSYLPAPSPFHMIINFNGNTTNLNPPGSVTQPFSTLAIGSGNAFFNSVPEPGSLALLGIGLLGFGATTWKRRHA